MRFNPDLATRENERVKLEAKLEGQKPAQTPISETPPAIPECVVKNPQGYIQITQFPGTIIAIEETHRGKDMYQTLESLETEQMKMPSILEFMCHRQNVMFAALRDEPLLYPNGQAVPKDIATDLWKYMSSGHRNGCWTWLNALFKKDKEQWYMESNLKVGQDSQGNRFLEGTSQPISFLNNVAYIDLNDLDFLRKGLPIRSSQQQEYNPLENIGYISPLNDTVAWFNMNKDSASLVCVGAPQVSNSRLGVFACAKISGGRK